MDEQGLLTIYALENVAPKGLKPSQKLVQKDTAYYSERQIGVTRLYAVRGANAQIDALLRCYNTDIVKGMVVIPEDGNQYQVDECQKVIGKDCVDFGIPRIKTASAIIAYSF
jgi:hypothetical protein